MRRIFELRHIIGLIRGNGIPHIGIEEPRIRAVCKRQFIDDGNRRIRLRIFDKVIVLSPRAWISHTRDLIRKYIPRSSNVVVVQGGSTRNETIMNGIRYIEENFGLDDNTIIVTHDSVRPFVSHRMIEENIRAAQECGACDTVIPATDTIVESAGHQFISSIPDRSTMYQGQTPQSFRAKKLRDIYESLTAAEKQILTDACKILVLKGEKVQLVEGDVTNIKITYPSDIRLAEALMEGK